MKKIIVFTTLILLLSCSDDKPQSYRLTPEFIAQTDFDVSTMYNNNHLKTLLEYVYEEDKKYHDLEAILLKTKGVDSKEYQEMQNTIKKTNAENLYRVESVLAKFGYPSSEFVGGKAAIAPFIVVGRFDDLGLHAKHFGGFYTTFKEGRMKVERFDPYLDELYKMKFNESLSMPQPYTFDRKIDTVILLLNLRKEPFYRNTPE